MFQLGGNDKESPSADVAADSPDSPDSPDSMAMLGSAFHPLARTKPDVIKGNEDGHATEVQKKQLRPGTLRPNRMPRKFGWFLLFTVRLIAQQCVYVEGDICNCQGARGSQKVKPDDSRTEP